MNTRGSSAVEFVLVLPWLIFFLAGMIAAVSWFFSGTILQYSAFRGARIASVYNFSGAEREVKRRVPQAHVRLGSDQNYVVGRTFKNWHSVLKPSAHALITPTLKGFSQTLNDQGKKDFFGYSFMDNWIGFCGDTERYGLCGN